MKKVISITKILFLSGCLFAQSVKRDTIFFDPAKCVVKIDAKQKLSELAEFLQKTEAYKVHIKGHADSLGNYDYNFKLAGNRAREVRDFLIKKGLTESRLTIQSFGEDKPIATNSDEELRKQNRRVVLYCTFQQKINFTECRQDSTNRQYTIQKFENDTIIHCKKGTQIEIRSETFYPLKISDIDFAVTEIFSLCDMITNNTVTRATNGDCLTSAGMLFVKPTYAGVEIQPNKGQFVKIKIPIKNGNPDKSMKLYGGVKGKDNQIIWKDIESEISYEEDGNQFYVFKMDTLIPFNLDKPIGIICKKNGHKIKIQKFKNAVICQTYPSEKYLAIAEQLKERKFALDKVINENKPLITIVAYDKQGNPYFAKGPLLELKYRRWRDMYVVSKKYFKKIPNDYGKPLTPNDFLCRYISQ